MKGIHKKCSDKKSYKQCVMIGGKELNAWMLGCVRKEPFNSRKKYRICANLQHLILNVVSVNEPDLLSSREEAELDRVQCEDNMSRKKRMKKGIRCNCVTKYD